MFLDRCQQNAAVVGELLRKPLAVVVGLPNGNLVPEGVARRDRFVQDVERLFVPPAAGVHQIGLIGPAALGWGNHLRHLREPHSGFRDCHRHPVQHVGRVATILVLGHRRIAELRVDKVGHFMNPVALIAQVPHRVRSPVVTVGAIRHGLQVVDDRPVAQTDAGTGLHALHNAGPFLQWEVMTPGHATSEQGVDHESCRTRPKDVEAVIEEPVNLLDVGHCLGSDVMDTEEDAH